MNRMIPSHCPKCNTDFKGSPIPQESIDRGLYGNETHYSRVIGGGYDGISEWQCPDCHHTWKREL